MTLNEFILKANETAMVYGYAVTDTGRLIGSHGKPIAAYVSQENKRRRLQVRTESGQLLFSGSEPTSIGAFLESYFYAEKVAHTQKIEAALCAAE